MPEEIITKTESLEGQLDYSGSDYNVKVTGSEPLIGVKLNHEYVDASTNPFNSVNIDVTDHVAVVMLYNKHKKVWDTQYNPTGAPGYTFDPSLENAKALVQLVNLHLYYTSMDVKSNVVYDPVTGGFTVTSESVEYDQTPSHMWGQDAEYNYPNERPFSQQIKRDGDGRLLTESGALFYDFDVTDSLASVTAYRNHRRAWEKAYPNTLFAYSEAEAIKLRDAINKHSAPYYPMLPNADRTIGSTMVYNKYIAGITTESRKAMPEYLVSLNEPDMYVDVENNKIMGLTDWGSPYANTPNFPPATPDNSDHS